MHVFNISEMDVEEAAQLISDSTEGLCVRLYRRRDGTVLTQDCPVGLRAAVRRRVAALTSSIAMGVGVLASVLFRPGPRTNPAATGEHFKMLGSSGLVEPSQFRMGQVAAEGPVILQRRNPFMPTIGDAAVPLELTEGIHRSSE